MIPKMILLSGGVIIFAIEIFMLVDLFTGSMLEKYHDMYPLVHYYCVCGFHLKINSFWPSNTLRVLKAVKHDKCCLSKLLFFAGKNISRKWQNYACEDMIKNGKELTKSDWYTYENLTRSDEGLPRKPLDLDDIY